LGQLDQFAKETFAEETEVVTHGAVAWQPPPEIGMFDVHLDGLLVVKDPRPSRRWRRHGRTPGTRMSWCSRSRCPGITST
jgi:hypothetical protein